jgi:exopolyphosphatase/guanosine-5'-triphosphate,3'-diphosphate pyrophosphatase
LQLRVAGPRLTLLFPAGWLEEHPLTRADLEKEADYLKKAGFQLEYGPAKE